MKWPDFIIDRLVTDEELARAISNVLGIQFEAVLVTSEIPGGALDKRIQLVVVRNRVRGDFRLSVELYPQAKELIERLDGLRLMDQLCASLRCKCLISDDSVNPYAMTLVEGPGVRRHVFLEADKLDLDVPEYVLKS